MHRRKISDWNSQARLVSGIFPICTFPLSRPNNSTYKEQSRKGPRHNPDLSRKNGKTLGLESPQFCFSQWNLGRYFLLTVRFLYLQLVFVGCGKLAWSFFKDLLMPLFFMGCFPMDFQEVKRPLRTKSVKRPIKVGKRPINEGKRPIKAMVLVGISVGCLMGCFRVPPPWRKTAPLKRPIKRSMISCLRWKIRFDRICNCSATWVGRWSRASHPHPQICRNVPPKYAIQWGSVWHKSLNSKGLPQKIWHAEPPKYGTRTPPSIPHEPFYWGGVVEDHKSIQPEMLLAAQCEIPPHIAQYPFEIVSQRGYRTHLPCFHMVSLRYPFWGGGIAPPLRMLSKGGNAQKRGRGYRTQLAMLRH